MKDPRKALKTPLRYPGGKSRAVTKMDQYFPDLRNYVEFREPFLGGGSVAIHISKKYPHLKITVNDLYEPLINFWVQLQTFGDELTNKLREYKVNHPNPEYGPQVEDFKYPALELFLNAKEAVTAWEAETIVPSILPEFTYDAVLAVITAPSTLAPAT